MSYFLIDVAEFGKKNGRKQILVKERRGFNNWEKAREVRSQLSTAQRLSQDVRGWLSYAKAMRPKKAKELSNWEKASEGRRWLNYVRNSGLV